MQRKANGRAYGTGKRLMSLLLALVAVLGCAGTAWAEEAPKTPAAIQNTYELDGITYFNVNASSFDDPPHYFRDLIGMRSDALGDKSIAQLWLEAGTGMALSRDPAEDPNTNTTGLATREQVLEAMRTGITNAGLGEFEVNGLNTGALQPFYAASIEDAEKKVENIIPQRMKNKLGALSTTSHYIIPDRSKDQAALEAAKKRQDVVAAVAYAYDPLNEKAYYCTEVYFTDFQAVALMPSDSGTNYVTQTLKNNKKADRVYASNVQNMTLSPVTTTQNVSTTWTSSVTSSVNGSSAYTFAEALKLGYEHNFAIAKISAEASFTATQAFTKGWSKTTTESKSGTISETVSVSLPPYTNVMLEQGSSTTEAETRYNCPIGLKYKVRIRTFAVYCTLKVTGTYYDGAALFDTTFGPDAREELYKRAIRDGDLDVDASGVNWMKAFEVDGVRDAVVQATKFVPVAPVGATFNETLDTAYTEIKGIAPIAPLAVVKILPPDSNFVSGQQLNYNNLNYLHVDMKVGESAYTNYIKLSGENAFGAEYYGFSYRNGQWVVAKPSGEEWTDDTAPVKLENDPATGYMRYTAVKPGTCFLKYKINENCYATASNAGVYTKNSDLVSTAALEITVAGVKEESKPAGTIEITGNYFGFVDKTPERLDKEGGLTVSIKDLSGKELDKPFVWEKMELDSRGITLNDANEVSFTKTGKYHVRVVCDDIAAKSDWYEIEVHNYTFTSEGANIMATCTDPQCPDMMYTLHRPEKTVYGDGKSAWASVTGKIAGLTPPNVEYRRGTEKLSTPPRDAGTYTASITIGGATAEVEYTIEKAKAVITELPVASQISVGSSLSSSRLTGGKANTAGSFAWSEPTIYPTLEDNGKTPYQVTFTPTNANYEPAFGSVTVPVVIARPHMTVRPGGRSLVYTGKAQELVLPGEATGGNLSYGVSQDRNIDPETLEYSEKIPTAAEAGTYYIWYAERDFDDIYIYLPPVTTVVEKAVPTVEFPVTQLLASGKDQPLIVDPVISPTQDVTIYYSLGDTENEIVDSPVGRELGEYAVYYRIESRSPSVESVPYGDPVWISIQTALQEQLPDLKVSLADWTYGDKPKKPVVSGNKGYPVSYRYRALGEDDEAYTETVPTDAGEYVVEAAVSSEDYYGTVTATAYFDIGKRTPVLGEDYEIQSNIVVGNGSYQPLVDIAVKDGTTLKLWCSFDRRNTLAGTPKKCEPGTYEIWYKVSGDKNYTETEEWEGPVIARILAPITVTVKDAAKFYDGEPMAVEYSIEGLPEDWRVDNVTFSGSITEAGSKSISVTKLSVLDADGNDMTQGCSIEYIPGQLVVLDEADLVVPAMLKEIEAEAFSGIAAKSVILPKDTELVGSGAFGNCKQLKAFIVCGAETWFDPDVLSGCEDVIIYAPDDSPAEELAEYNHFDFIPLVNQPG